ncbi:hypothetical protein JZ751_023985 [Albula glossodonta]|uniref:Uncharacterized protein n=1 Tax=Albula glossodonta TaxID=121402 RepID=A0A8T2NFZ0_9TELE|nr:hypothetical protein JZ751_023985 [Albula glossodonta]
MCPCVWQLEGTLQELRRQKLQTSEKNQELSRTNQELEGQLERIRGQLQETLSHVQAMRSSVTHRQSLPQIQGPPSASERIEKSGEISGPQVLNLDFAAESQKTEAHEAVSHGDVVFERSGSVLGDYIQQDSFTGFTGVKGDASKGRLISIEEDPLPDLVNTSQSTPQWHQGEAMWDKQRAMQRGDRGSQSTLSRSPSAPDVLYNVVLVGNSAVGKTSFMRRFQSGEFCTDHCATIGLDSCIQTLHIDGTRVILQLWDTAGQERYHSITKQILRKAQGLLLMYDITSSSSFLDVRYWLSSIQEGASDDVIILLLGNKNDSSKREVSYQDGETLAREYSIRFMECSAATGDNVSLSMNILARMLKQQVDEKQEGNFMLHKMPPKKKSGCC